MLVAKAHNKDGTIIKYIIGIDRHNVANLMSGKPMLVRLTKLGGESDIVVCYADDLKTIKEAVEDAQGGPLPNPTPLPEGTIE